MHAIDKIFSLVPGYSDYIRRGELKSADLEVRLFCALKIFNKIKAIRKHLKKKYGVDFSKEFTDALALLSALDSKSEGLKSMVAGGGTFFEPNLISDDHLAAVLEEDSFLIHLSTEFEKISLTSFDSLLDLVTILIDFDQRLEKAIEARKSFFENLRVSKCLN